MHWIDSLATKYLDIFEDCFQFDPPDGWRTLVESLVEYINWHNTVHDTDIQVYDISKAHGGLKFVIHNQPRQPIIAEEIHGAIHLAETMSCKLCQYCGVPSPFRKYRGPNNQLILASLCDAHFAEKLDEINIQKS